MGDERIDFEELSRGAVEHEGQHRHHAAGDDALGVWALGVDTTLVQLSRQLADLEQRLEQAGSPASSIAGAELEALQRRLGLVARLLLAGPGDTVVDVLERILMLEGARIPVR